MGGGKCCCCCCLLSRPIKTVLDFASATRPSNYAAPTQPARRIATALGTGPPSRPACQFHHTIFDSREQTFSSARQSWISTACQQMAATISLQQPHGGTGRRNTVEDRICVYLIFVILCPWAMGCMQHRPGCKVPQANFGTINPEQNMAVEITDAMSLPSVADGCMRIMNGALRHAHS